jgi:hypothetical protein
VRGNPFNSGKSYWRAQGHLVHREACLY